jgi:transcription elongation GreA/GreB family factor
VSIRKVLLTPQGRNDILATRQSIYQKLQELSEEGTPMPTFSRTCQGKMTGDADEVARQSKLLRKQLEEVDSIIDNHIIVHPTRSTDHVAIGVIVTFQRYDALTKQPIGRQEVYEIGGYRSTDVNGNLPRISYDAPLAAAMRSLEVGEETADITIKGKKFFLKVLKIELPGLSARDDEPELALPMKQ